MVMGAIDQPVAGVGNQRRAGVGDQRYVRAFGQRIDQSVDHPASLCSCSASQRGGVARGGSSFRLTRVSSAAITPTSASTWLARGERSSRLPSGVATIHNVPEALERPETGGEDGRVKGLSM